MADGSFLELPETFCSASKPASQQDCKKDDCPSEWLLSNWTEVCMLPRRGDKKHEWEEKSPQKSIEKTRENKTIPLALWNSVFVTVYAIVYN
jgi:hypothetical protein